MGTLQETKPPRQMRIAFEQFVDTGWIGGTGYLQNLFTALRSLEPQKRPYTILFHQADDKPRVGPSDTQLAMPAKSKALRDRIYQGVARRIDRRLLPEPKIAGDLREHKADAFFTCSPYETSAGVPLIGWVPDFQYRHLPEIAGDYQVRLFQDTYAQLIAQSEVVIVSSQDVLKDLKTFFPSAADKAHVVQFVAQIPAEAYAGNPADICQKYALPERFFYLPNQFWSHKNHRLVLEALKLCRKMGEEITVVCTGNTHDYRNPNFFPLFLAELAQSGVHDRMRILGLVPRSDVYQLQRQAIAIVQPSLFEGWSTSIEEAKSLGKRVIASDLAVHHEQLPEADFFPRHSPQQLAEVLAEVARTGEPGPDPQKETNARAALAERTREFAERFLQAVAKASNKPGGAPR